MTPSTGSDGPLISIVPSCLPNGPRLRFHALLCLGPATPKALQTLRVGNLDSTKLSCHCTQRGYQRKCRDIGEELVENEGGKERTGR
jgi:hypothetical protein